MTSPAKADKSAIAGVLRKHVWTTLQNRLGNATHLTVDARALAPIAQDVAVQEMAEGIRVDPAVAEVVGEYQVLFGDYRVYLTGLIGQSMELVKICDGLREYEFINKTVHGDDAKSAAKRLEKLLKKLYDVLNELSGLQTRLPLVADQPGLAPFTAFNAKMRNLIEDTKRQADEVGAGFDDAVDFEVVKAIVRNDPHYKLGTAFYAVRSGIAGMSLAGDICGLIPNPYTTPVSIALRNVARGLSIVETIVRRQAYALSNENRVKEYRNKHADGDKWDAHTKDKSLMAQMLVDKRKADLELALVCADAAIGPVLDLFEYSDIAWDVIRQAIESTFVGYLDARIKLLKEELGQTPEGNVVKRAADVFGQALLDAFKEDLFKILNPLNALKGAVLSSLGDNIATLIWEHLPIDPGQAVDGATLKAQLDELAEKLVSGMPKRDEAFAAKVAAEEKAAERPTVDKDGKAVEKVLSGVLVDDDGKAHRLVRIGGVVGALYLADLEFRPGQVNDDVLAPLDVLPATDNRARAIDEIDLTVGFTLGHPAPAGMTATKHLWVRIGVIWGYLDTETEKFWPATVDPAGFANWRQRKIVPDGYYEDGEHVKGKWYRPFPEHHAGYYLFKPKGKDEGEWARSQDNTGSGRGANNTIAGLTKPSDRFDLSRL
ncbi:hypothetical protein [Actinophytocola algeriensis]|uniref:Uncharacterized protein n=1 Tax=Actinophytocola algeriensis TaxID=1768010 RepID=A0A7W7Q524_9PSEU|nr:hypothetical protein [Actinophytocola algeriensis]MBB4907027.1 hypothetical protein [Actinophytocola algeriensis]MBE1478510.1 hypothetical protein [Actinophytocola algeriensis]